jgi:alkanesulfonate monooxygenase SsuD/methylene tetrahydromethanopterin reductase-like flavin-dependent oxidoreductase (luciferase family)
VPIFVGGRARRSLRRAARFGDGWVGWLHSPQGFAAVRSELQAERASIQATGAFWYGMQIPVLVEERGLPSTDADPVLLEPTQRYAITGSAARVVEGLRNYWEAGATRFKLAILDGEEHVEQVQLLAKEVLPVMRQWS